MDIWGRLVSGRTTCFILSISILMSMKDGGVCASKGNKSEANGGKKKFIPDLVCNNTWCASEFNQDFPKFRFNSMGLLAAGYAGDSLESKVRLTFLVIKKKNNTGTYILEAKALVETMNHKTLSAKTILNAFGIITEDVYPVLPEPVGDGYKPYCTPLTPLPGINICLNLYYFKCNLELEGRACFKIEFVVYQKVICKIQFDCINFSRGNITLTASNGGPASSNPNDKKKWYELRKKSFVNEARR